MSYLQILLCICLIVLSSNSVEEDKDICIKGTLQTVTEVVTENIQHNLKGLQTRLQNEIQRTFEGFKKKLQNKMHRVLKDKCSPPKLVDCSDIMKYRKQSGVEYVSTNGLKVKVYCDMTTYGGGWTVIQKRFNGSVNFTRGWTDYEKGFGDVNGEYWLGNKFIHKLTSSAKYKLRFDLWNDTNVHTYAEYTPFVVGDSKSKYKLTIGGYQGDAEDGFAFSNGMKFTTIDQDNDLFPNNCGAWWFDSCGDTFLNGDDRNWAGDSNFSKTVMMIRRI